MLKVRAPDMWNYRELLPMSDETFIISLGEGMTPLRRVNHVWEYIGLNHLMIKDESLNPTGSFKAWGISAAISAALERDVKKFVVPSAGNAAAALAAYAA